MIIVVLLKKKKKKTKKNKDNVGVGVAPNMWDFIQIFTNIQSVSNVKRIPYF